MRIFIAIFALLVLLVSGCSSPEVLCRCESSEGRLLATETLIKVHRYTETEYGTDTTRYVINVSDQPNSAILDKASVICKTLNVE